MKQFVPNQVFLDDVDRYEPNETYEVSDEKAYYFRMNGWGDIVDSEYPANQGTEDDVTLDIHNASLNVKDSNG